MFCALFCVSYTSEQWKNGRETRESWGWGTCASSWEVVVVSRGEGLVQGWPWEEGGPLEGQQVVSRAPLELQAASPRGASLKRRLRWEYGLSQELQAILCF